MKFGLLILLSFILTYGSCYLHAQNVNDDEGLLKSAIDKPYEFYAYSSDENITYTDRLLRLEQDIDRLKFLTAKYAEPRLYFLIGQLYGERSTLLKTQLVYSNKDELFSIPVMQENLQGIRDNCTEAIQLQKQGKGTPLETPMFGTCSGPLMTRQFYERAQKAYLDALPEVIECQESNDPYNDCITYYKKDISLDKYQKIFAGYKSYGFFDDAERINNEIARLSEEGKKIAEENVLLIAQARQNYDPNKYKDDLALMLPGGTPKSLTIRAADAIAENHKAVIAKEQAEKNKAQEIQAQAASSAAAVVAAENLAIEKAEKTRQMWIAFAGALGLIVVVAGIFVMKRRKSHV